MPSVVWLAIAAVTFAFTISFAIMFYLFGLAPVIDEAKRQEEFHKHSGDL